MRRGPLLKWCKRIFKYKVMRQYILSSISSRFQLLSSSLGQVAHVLLTRSPLGVQVLPVRLACIRHAASVHPEPGSNSPFDWLFMNELDVRCFQIFLVFLNWRFLFSFQRAKLLRSLKSSYIIPNYICVVNNYFYFFFIFYSNVNLKIFNSEKVLILSFFSFQLTI